MYLRFVNQWIRLEHELSGSGSGSKPGSPQPPDIAPDGAISRHSPDGFPGHSQVPVPNSGDHHSMVSADEDSPQPRDQFWVPGFQEACIRRHREHYIGSNPIRKTDLCSGIEESLGHGRYSGELPEMVITSVKPPMTLYETIQENEELDLEGESWRGKTHRPLEQCVKVRQEDILHPSVGVEGTDEQQTASYNGYNGADGEEDSGQETEYKDDDILHPERFQKFIIENVKKTGSISRVDHAGVYSPRPQLKGKHHRLSPRVKLKNKQNCRETQSADAQSLSRDKIPPQLDLWKGHSNLQAEPPTDLICHIPHNLDLWRERASNNSAMRKFDKTEHTNQARCNSDMSKSACQPLVPSRGSSRATSNKESVMSVGENTARPHCNGNLPVRNEEQVIQVYHPLAFNRRSNKNNRQCIKSDGSCQGIPTEKCYGGGGKDSGRYSMKSEVLNELQDKLMGVYNANSSVKGTSSVGRGRAATVEQVKRLSGVSQTGNVGQDALRYKLNEELMMHCSRNQICNSDTDAAKHFGLHAARPHRHSFMIDHHEKRRPSTSMERFARTSLAIPESGSGHILHSQIWSSNFRCLEDIDSVISDDISDLDEVSVHMAIEAEDWFDGLANGDLSAVGGIKRHPSSHLYRDSNYNRNGHQLFDSHRSKGVIQRNRKLNINKFHELHKQRLARRWDPEDSVCSEVIHECSDGEESEDVIIIETAL